MRPLTRICVTSESTSSGYGEEFELPALGDLVPELAVLDVADIGEVAGPARPLVVNLLTLGQQLQPFHGGVDLGAAALADLAHVVAQRRAGRLLRLRHGQEDEADPIGSLRLIRVGVAAQPL